MYLLDTCIISETRNKTPNPGVMNWLAKQDESTLFLSALTLGEVKKGICALGKTAKARELAKWLAKLESEFQGRILAVNATVAELWGEIMSNAAKTGKPRPPIDALIAATALAENLTVVTHNTADMRHTGVKILDPFTS